MAKLLTEDEHLLALPQVGQAVTGTVLAATNKEVRLDIPGFGTGIVRGPNLYLESADYADLKVGDEVEAAVVGQDNENGELELSFRTAGHKKVWDGLKKLASDATIISAEILDANRGGLLIKANRITGFLPVSQLSPEHYPRVQGGDKNKILEKLKTYIGSQFDVKVITVDDEAEKMIVSEKAAWEEQQHGVLSKYSIGDVIEGTVTAVTDFGAFVEFGEKLEGLVHISELAWQRIDDPKEVVAVGQAVKAKIINLQGSKIFLSMKSLIADPWKQVGERYAVGQVVKGKVLKINPFGLFVELDPEIHGLAHISELSDKPVEDVNTIAKPGEVRDFVIVSMEPEQHRLGLSIKRIGQKEKKPKAAKAEDSAEAPAEPAADAPAETPAE